MQKQNYFIKDKSFPDQPTPLLKSLLILFLQVLWKSEEVWLPI